MQPLMWLYNFYIPPLRFFWGLFRAYFMRHSEYFFFYSVILNECEESFRVSCHSER